jgi:hypothetical protein
VDLPQHPTMWGLTSDRDGIQVFHSTEFGNLVMAHIGLPKLSAQMAMDVMCDVAGRHAWDPVFGETRRLKKLGEVQSLIYVATTLPSSLDKKQYAFCQTCSELRDVIPAQGAQASILHILVYEDATELCRLQCGIIPKARTVLAETLLSGFIIQDDPDDPESSIMMRMIQVDLVEGYTAADAAVQFSETIPVWRDALVGEGQRRAHSSRQTVVTQANTSAYSRFTAGLARLFYRA